MRPMIPTAQTVRRIDTGANKNLGVAYALWLVLGLVGAHKFYLGRGGVGVIYIFTMGGLLIGWTIDAFTLPAQVRRANTAGYIIG